jgi:hypothetical protein
MKGKVPDESAYRFGLELGVSLGESLYIHIFPQLVKSPIAGLVIFSCLSASAKVVRGWGGRPYFMKPMYLPRFIQFCQIISVLYDRFLYMNRRVDLVKSS